MVAVHLLSQHTWMLRGVELAFGMASDPQEFRERTIEIMAETCERVCVFS